MKVVVHIVMRSFLVIVGFIGGHSSLVLNDLERHFQQRNNPDVTEVLSIVSEREKT